MSGVQLSVNLLFLPPQNTNTNGAYDSESLSPDQDVNPERRKRNAEPGRTSTATYFDPKQSTSVNPAFTQLRSVEQRTDVETIQDINPSVALKVTEIPSNTYRSFQPPTTAFSATPVPPITPPPWLTMPDDDLTTESSYLTHTSGTLRLSTRLASNTGRAVASGSPGTTSTTTEQDRQ